MALMIETPDKHRSLSPDPLRGLVRSVLKEIGEDPGREGLERTPERVADTYRFLTGGYERDPSAILEKAIFHVETCETVVVRDIAFHSLCEHHMLPFFGKAHVAYIPHGRVVGLSKIPRVVDLFARRLQVQERLTAQIAETLQEVLSPRGVGVLVEAVHLCMRMRGVEEQACVTTTSALRGEMAEAGGLRAEFLCLSNSTRARLI